MRRADRLMSLVQILRDGALHRAGDLAAAVGVSPRTIYRDMETLAASGVPIEGERGVGYHVTAAVTLPPLNLTMTEVEALHLGLLAVSGGSDKELATAAQSLTQKLDAVMPLPTSPIRLDTLPRPNRTKTTTAIRRMPGIPMLLSMMFSSQVGRTHM